MANRKPPEQVTDGLRREWQSRKNSPENMKMMGPGPGRGRGGPGGRAFAEKPKNMRQTLRRLISYIGKNKYFLIMLFGIVILSTVSSLVSPMLQKNAISAISLDSGKLHVDFAGLVKNLAILAVVYIISSILSYLQSIFSAKLSQETARSLRADLFSKIIRLPIKFTDTYNHGDLMSRVTNDVDNISNSISQSVGSLISGVLTLIGSFSIMMYYSPFMTLVSMSTIVLTVIASSFMTRLMRKYFLRQQILLGKLNGHIEEMVTGYKTVVAFNRQDDAKAEFRQMSDELRVCGIKAQIFGGAMGPVMNVISNLNFLIVAIVGGYLAFNGAITIGVIHAFIQYSKQFSRPVNEIANQYAEIQTAIAGAERVFGVMDAEPEKREGNLSFEPDSVRGDISIRNVDFSYVEGKQVLKDFSLDVKSGQKIAIVGATGSGKTTVVNLLTRFYDIDSGSITIDGKSIYNIPLPKLRQSIAIVLQDTVLFNDTIEANIRYGRLDSNQDDIKSAAHTANADLFIEHLSEGYKTVLSQGGGNLSQGQRQLLAIARAVLADPKILILDEATSSVDTRTEMNIQSAMVALMKNRTSLIIAHRLSTIRDADKIVVIDDGRVAEVGNHDELIARGGCYYQLYKKQFAGVAT